MLPQPCQGVLDGSFPDAEIGKLAGGSGAWFGRVYTVELQGFAQEVFPCRDICVAHWPEARLAGPGPFRDGAVKGVAVAFRVAGAVDGTRQVVGGNGGQVDVVIVRVCRALDPGLLYQGRADVEVWPGNDPLVRARGLKARVVLPGDDAVPLGVALMEHLCGQVLAFQVPESALHLGEALQHGQDVLTVDLRQTRPQGRGALVLEQAGEQAQLVLGHRDDPFGVATCLPFTVICFDPRNWITRLVMVATSCYC